MPEFILSILAVIRVFLRSRSDTALEVLALRQQVAVLKRERPRPHLNPLDRIFWTTLRRFWSHWTDVLVIVRPETAIDWHRAGFRFYWRWRSRPRGGRPKITEEIRALIRRLAEENPDWGAPKIHGELLKLGLVLSERGVARYLQRVGRPGDPGKRWLAFLRNHREVIAAVGMRDHVRPCCYARRGGHLTDSIAETRPAGWLGEGCQKPALAFNHYLNASKPLPALCNGALCRDQVLATHRQRSHRHGVWQFAG